MFYNAPLYTPQLFVYYFTTSQINIDFSREAEMLETQLHTGTLQQ